MLDIITNSINEHQKFLDNIKFLMLSLDETEPKSIINELLGSNENNTIILNTIELMFGGEGVYKFQSELFEILSNYFNKNLNFNIRYSYNLEDAPGIIKVLSNINSYRNEIANIDVFNRQLIILPDKRELQINSEINEINEIIAQKELELQELSNDKLNPLYSAGSNPLKIANVLIRKKQVVSDISTQFEDCNNEIIELEKMLSAKRVEIDSLHNVNLELVHIKEKLQKRFENYFNYTTIIIADKKDTFDDTFLPNSERINTSNNL